MKLRATYLALLTLLATALTAAAQPAVRGGVPHATQEIVVSAHTNRLPPARHKAVYGLGFYVAPSAYDYSAVARTITQGATTKSDKARSLYLWLCANISYDTSGASRTADQAWDSRRAVCQGYCELFYRLAETLGLRSRLVLGKCRAQANASELEDHCWLSVDTERGELLMDPTWGAGYSVGQRFVRQSHPLVWYDVHPAWFVFTHLPKLPRRQLLDPAVGDDDFPRLPFVSPLAGRLGIEPRAALRRILDGGDALPVVSQQHADVLDRISLDSVPTTLHLRTDSTYTFCISKTHPDVGQLLLLNGDDVVDETAWQVDSLRYTLRYTPRHSGKLHLAVSTTEGIFVQRRRVLQYVVE